MEKVVIVLALIVNLFFGLVASLLYLTPSGRDGLWKADLKRAKARKTKIMGLTPDEWKWRYKNERPEGWDEAKLREGLFLYIYTFLAFVLIIIFLPILIF